MWDPQSLSLQGPTPGCWPPVALSPGKAGPQLLVTAPASPKPGHTSSHKHPFFLGPQLYVEYPLMHAGPVLSASLHPHSWPGGPGHQSFLTAPCPPSIHSSHSHLSDLCTRHIITVIAVLSKPPVAIRINAGSLPWQWGPLPPSPGLLHCPSLLLLQPHWPSSCSWKSPSILLPQGFCICHLSSWRPLPPALHIPVSHLSVSAQCHFSEAFLTTVGKEGAPSPKSTHHSIRHPDLFSS